MLKRIVVGILGISVVGAGGAAVLYHSAQSADAAPTPAAAAVEAVPAAADEPAAAIPAGSESSVGDPWTMSGTIAGLDDFGLNLAGADGSSYYVELGPPDFWQTQGVTLAVQDAVTIDGFANEGQYHAGVVTLSDGQQLRLRDEAGRPLWSGSAQNAGGGGGGSGTPQPQAQVDEWITLEGIVTAVGRNSLTVQATTGDTLVIQMGRPGFAASQGITFRAGDEVIVVGFYQGTQFNAGDITQVSTGLRLMLRDPNGRPLWAGPGNGNGQGGSGQGGQGSAQATPAP